MSDTEFDPDVLVHIGIIRRSGRYPWGSGNNAYQRSISFLGMFDELKKKGLKENEIAEAMGLTNEKGQVSSTMLRTAKAIAKNEVKAEQRAQAFRLSEKGWSNGKIAERMGLKGESSVRNLLSDSYNDKRDVMFVTADMLKDKMAPGEFLDVGKGTSNHLGVTDNTLSTAVALLKEQGYETHNVKVRQLGTGEQTSVKVLAPPGTTYKDVVTQPGKIKSVAAYSEDMGRSWNSIQKPTDVSAKRVAIRYAEEGGSDADGVIYVRRGVDDLSLGKAQYAQVRISIEGTHYLKGMAMYKDDMPDGVDLVFNTNKSDTGNKLDAMKAQKVDKETGAIDELNPFGAIVRQHEYAPGKLSAMNIVNEEGDWHEWSVNLSSQMLSKQPVTLAKDQLNKAYASREEEYKEIMAYTNPTVRKKLLQSFADDADSASVHLKAAGLPRQRTQVILPIESMKDTEVYAPNFNNGEKVVLVRYPHGGKFEIPELTVNNRQPDAKRTLGSALDAIGINPNVAARLSGADFDGDTVLVIPNDSQRVKSEPPLAALKNYDPQRAYPAYDGMKTIDGGYYDAKTGKVDYRGKSPIKSNKQRQMGDVSNLITDMTIRGAPNSEIARAVKHSMVVIDAEKHKLNVSQSFKDNGIAALKKEYQGKSNAGASTLISKSTSQDRVPERTARKAKDGGPIDPATGKKVYTETGASYVNKKGKTVYKTTKSTKGAETDDAFTLSSGTTMEAVYATHSNKLKSLANQARKSMLSTEDTPYSSTAAQTYKKEVDRLTAALNVAKKNAPLERQAQLVANETMKAKRLANPDMDASEVKKAESLALEAARNRVGAKKDRIQISPREWEAIQAGAVTKTKLGEILDNTDIDVVKSYATPKDAPVMGDAKVARAKSLLALGYTQSEIAAQLGVPTSTLNSALK